MKILFINCAIPNSFVALIVDEQIQIKSIEQGKESDQLILKIEELLEENEIQVSDLNKIYLINGPGSFTGLRISVTIANVWAHEMNIKLVPINTFNFLRKYIDDDQLPLVMKAGKNDFFMVEKPGKIEKNDIDIINQAEMENKNIGQIYAFIFDQSLVVNNLDIVKIDQLSELKLIKTIKKIIAMNNQEFDQVEILYIRPPAISKRGKL